MHLLHDELDACNVAVNARSELTNLLCGNGSVSELARMIVLPEETGGSGMRDRSLLPKRSVSGGDYLITYLLSQMHRLHSEI